MTEAELTVDFAGQDAVIPFQVAPLDVRGRVVQLGPMLDTILERHDYPEPVSRLLAEAMTLTVLLGTSLKFDGKFILQTQTDGPVSMMVADFRTPGSVRGYARFDENSLNEAVSNGSADAPSLLGKGMLAMTIDQGEFTQRYQGIVELDGISLEEVAHRYFRQSEQIPTEVRLAVGEVLTRQEGQKPRHDWTAGGVLVQFFPDSEERMRQKDLDSGDGSSQHDFVEDDAWAETRALMGSIDDVELTDKSVEPERLLFRLFHEHGVHAFEAVPVRDDCSCSRQKVADMLAGLSKEERDQSIEKNAEGSSIISVACEFCSQRHVFDPSELNEPK